MLGKTIDSAVIERGLRELCPDIHFDMGTKLNGWHPLQKSRQGVFWHGQHICAMDRGLVPEFKQWNVVTGVVEVGWEEADKEDVTFQSHIIRRDSEEYMDAALKLMANTNGYEMRPDGSIMHYKPMALRKRQGRVALVGWRHTFERIINRDLPGLTRSAIAKKFEVDMLKFPVGAPHELVAELTEE